MSSGSVAGSVRVESPRRFPQLEPVAVPIALYRSQRPHTMPISKSIPGAELIKSPTSMPRLRGAASARRQGEVHADLRADHAVALVGGDDVAREGASAVRFDDA